MKLAPHGRRYRSLALAMSMLACGGDSTAPVAGDKEVLVVSLAGLSADDAGIVLRLTGAIEDVESARASLDVAWAHNENDATVVILGRLSEASDVLVIRRSPAIVPLSAELVEVAAADGAVSFPSSVVATVRSLAER